jgi:hypothetical protein
VSQARIQKLNALLKRIEVRRVQPRLHAVAAPVASPPALAAAPAPAPEPIAAAPIALAPATRPTPPAPLFTPEPFAPITLPPAAEAPRKEHSSSPLESAMSALDDSGPLQVQALGEPIAPAERMSPPLPSLASPPAALLAQDMMLTHRPDAGGGEFDMPIELTQPATKKPLVAREPTVEFETAKVRVSAREARTVVELPPPEARAVQPEAPLTAPSQTIEAPPLTLGAQPARAVSAARIEAPKTFGELLERSLAMRPRA